MIYKRPYSLWDLWSSCSWSSGRRRTRSQPMLLYDLSSVRSQDRYSRQQSLHRNEEFMAKDSLSFRWFQLQIFDSGM